MTDVFIDAQIRALRELLGVAVLQGQAATTIFDRLAYQAERILHGHEQGNQAVTFQLGCWCPGFIGANPEQIMAEHLSIDQAQLSIALEHGYNDWSEVAALNNVVLDNEFESSADAVVHGDLAQLQTRLGMNPSLVSQRSQYGHRATLLHYIGANGIESYRQITPLNAVEVTDLLIKAGADANATADMYGGGSTTLGLVESSAHPYHAGVTASLAKFLRDAGAV